VLFFVVRLLFVVVVVIPLLSIMFCFLYIIIALLFFFIIIIINMLNLAIPFKQNKKCWELWKTLVNKTGTSAKSTTTYSYLFNSSYLSPLLLTLSLTHFFHLLNFKFWFVFECCCTTQKQSRKKRSIYRLFVRFISSRIKKNFLTRKTKARA